MNTNKFLSLYIFKFLMFRMTKNIFKFIFKNIDNTFILQQYVAVAQST